MSETVTVICRVRPPVKGLAKVFRLSFSRLPGQTFGPYHLTGAIEQVEFAADLSRLDARSLVLDAATAGSATTQIGS